MQRQPQTSGPLWQRLPLGVLRKPKGVSEISLGLILQGVIPQNGIRVPFGFPKKGESTKTGVPFGVLSVSSEENHAPATKGTQSPRRSRSNLAQRVPLGFRLPIGGQEDAHDVEPRQRLEIKAGAMGNHMGNHMDLVAHGNHVETK